MLKQRRSSLFKNRYLPLLTLCLLLAAQEGFALTLDEAKASGLIGETPKGYLGIVVEKPAMEVKQLVQDINSKRKEKYQGIASKTKANLATVESLAGKKAINKTKPGFFVQLPSGEWIEKKKE